MKDHLQPVCNLASRESAAEHSMQNQNRRGLVAFGRRPASCARRQRPAEREGKCGATVEAEVTVGANLNPEGRLLSREPSYHAVFPRGQLSVKDPKPTQNSVWFYFFSPGQSRTQPASVCLIAVPLGTATWADSRFSCPLLCWLFTRRTCAVNPKD